MNLEKLETFRQLLLLLFLSVISFVGCFLRSFPFGYDSYYFITLQNGFLEYWGHNQTATLFFSFLPHSFVFYNLLMFFCFFISICGLYFGLTKVFDKETSLLTVVLCIALAPILIFDFAQFQNEVLAYPFIFWSFYFLMAKKYFHTILLSILGGVFWLGSFVWLGIVFFPALLVIFVGYLLNIDFLSHLFVSTFPNISGIAYNTWLWGLFDLFLLFPFIFVVFLDRNRKDWQIWLIISLICLSLSARFVILAVPFIALGIAQAIPYLKKIIGEYRMIIILGLILIMCWNIALFLQHPTLEEMNLTQNFVNECKDKNVSCYNDWSFGWWVTSLGGKTDYKSSIPNPDYNTLQRPYFAITSNVLECDNIKSEGIINYYWCKKE